ncbi:MAG TPA: c-type cytochrome [Acidobacteriaceae bacterium]|nr:c-type cytochrome [Acidobacteriaceae bacterium]
MLAISRLELRWETIAIATSCDPAGLNIHLFARGIEPPVKPRRAWSRLSRRVSAGLCLVLPFLFVTHVAFSQPALAQPFPPGKAIFEQHCAKCHGDSGQGISAVVSIAGPCLQAEHNRGKVVAAVELGPGHMPSFVYTLSLPQIHAVADYVTHDIAVIPLDNGDLSEGGKLFRRNCAACHRTAVRGGALAFIGTNAPALTGDSAAIVAGAIRWGPGPMPAFPAAAISDQQVASIVKYVSYVQHPASPGGSPLNWYGPVAEGFAAWVGVLLLVCLTFWIERGGKG